MLPRTTAGIVAISLVVAVLSLPAPAVAASKCDGKRPTVRGTDGNDHVVGTPFDDVIDAGAGDDRIEAGPGDDTICAGRGADVIDAGRGADLVDPGVETTDQDERGLPDDVDGGDGSDTVTYESAPLPVAVLLGMGQATIYWAQVFGT